MHGIWQRVNPFNQNSFNKEEHAALWSKCYTFGVNIFYCNEPEPGGCCVINSSVIIKVVTGCISGLRAEVKLHACAIIYSANHVAAAAAATQCIQLRRYRSRAANVANGETQR